MPTVRPKIIVGELYHVYNRGVEKRITFMTRQHYMRFIAAMQFFNTSRQVTLRDFLGSNVIKKTGVQPLQEGRRLVQIGAFILMPNHFHFLLKPLVEGGVSLFMQKLGSGYTAFFNLKHSRSGALFQGRYKVKHIDSDRYARYIQAYIPLNALDRVMPNWREDGIKRIDDAKRIAGVHSWSSFSSYIGENRFPGILDQTFINDFFETKKEFEDFIFSWSEDDNKYIFGMVAG
ncbi:MAG: transposase [Candidatus Sungiibacteriota bacterium]